MLASAARLAASLRREACRVARSTGTRRRRRESTTLIIPPSSSRFLFQPATPHRFLRSYSSDPRQQQPQSPTPRPPPSPPPSSSSPSSPSPHQSTPPPPPRRSSNQIKFWPFAAIIGLGFFGYAALVNQRKEMTSLPGAKSPAGHLGSPMKSTPAFSPTDVTVVFVLGGPGAGKGTQCARLVREYGFAHLSAGDLLRAEQARPSSQFGALISNYIRTGAIVPMEVTIQLLENAMAEIISSKKQQAEGSNSDNNNSNSNSNSNSKRAKFLIDGFPRKMDQALRFEEVVCPARFVLFFDCPEAELERRLLERGKTSGREDDNPDSIRARFRTFVDVSMPVVDHYAAQGRVVRIDATPGPDAVFAETEKQISKRISKET